MDEWMDLGDLSSLMSENLETLKYSSRTFFSFGQSGIVSRLTVSRRWESRSGKTSVESGCGVIGKISSHIWTTFNNSWIGDWNILNSAIQTLMITTY
jgi:hypothetical protein